MKDKSISNIISKLLLVVTAVTFLVIIILFILDKYTVALLVEDTFFVVLTIISLWLVPKFEQHFKLNMTESVKVQLYIFLFALFMVGNVYNVIPITLWFDKILHLMSGIFLTSIGILFAKKWIPNGRRKTIAYIGFMYSVTIAVLWELVEFLGDIIMSVVFPSYPFRLQTFHITEPIWFLPQPHGLADTMIDVTLGVLGAFIVMMYYRYSKKHSIK